MRIPQISNARMFAMFKNCIHSELLKPIFVPEPLWNSDNQKLSNFRIDFFYHSVISPFAVKVFLLLFSSHCSTQKNNFSDSGSVIKTPQPSSAAYGAPPFTGHQTSGCNTITHDNMNHLFVFRTIYFYLTDTFVTLITTRLICFYI